MKSHALGGAIANDESFLGSIASKSETHANEASTQ